MRLKTMLYPLVKIMSKFLFSILFLSHLFDVLASSEAPRTYLQKKPIYVRDIGHAIWMHYNLDYVYYNCL